MQQQVIQALRAAPFKFGDFTAYQYLPAFAIVALERLDADNTLRTSVKLDEFLDAYAKVYGVTCDDKDRASSHYIAVRRFYDFELDLEAINPPQQRQMRF